MSTALLTDHYELTMLDAARHSGKWETECVFDVFTRRLPSGRRYGVVAGIGRVIEAIGDFRFGDAELAFLDNANIVSGDTLAWLANYRFRGDVRGYREGEVYFPHSPILSVQSTFADAVVLETVILSILNHDSAVAAAAARMVGASEGRSLIEMGSRRTGEQSAWAAARATYIAGFDGTSNLEAGRRYGIPTFGTAAHAFTLLHDSEKDAFTAQVATLGEGTTLLVDTYDDIDRAVSAAIEVGGVNLGAVRIDSGDLAAVAKQVRAQLDTLGATATRIVVTSDLDEYTIAGLGSAPVNAFGVGTSVVTGSGHPAAGLVYKLVARRNSLEAWVPVQKTSTGKSNTGGIKSATRRLASGIATAEEIILARATPTTPGRPLIVNHVVGGEPVATDSPEKVVVTAREHHRMAMAELPADSSRLAAGEPVIPTIFSDTTT
jgi:nicotinate phosphoribosyltransferase